MYRIDFDDYIIVFKQLKEIATDYDHFDMRELIVNDKEYNWAQLIADIKTQGLKQDILIEPGPNVVGPPDGITTHITTHGNHRLRVLKYLYGVNNKMRFKLKQENDEANR